ncbi:hypothetical protein BGX20_006147, partial [Mortierella sp. AD010]
ATERPFSIDLDKKKKGVPLTQLSTGSTSQSITIKVVAVAKCEQSTCVLSECLWKSQ